MGSSGSKKVEITKSQEPAKGVTSTLASHDAPDSSGATNERNGNGAATSSSSKGSAKVAKESPSKQQKRTEITAKASGFVSAVACHFDDMKDGEMRSVDIGDSKVLLVRDDGTYYALGHKCTHYGAPLVNGVLCNGRIRCQLHGACFNVKTGDIEDFPGLDSLPKYQVEIHENEVTVKVPEQSLKSSKRVKPMSCQSMDADETYLIVGGGGAASVAVETLRQEGFTGRIIMATEEKFLPYDRTKLSKSPNTSGNELALRDTDFYSVYDIEVLTEKKAVEVDTSNGTVKFQDDSSLVYDKLLLASGSRPRKLSVRGDHLNGIYYLRTPVDGNNIHEAAVGKRVVIIGNSFIGMEVAAYLSNKSQSVTVVGRSSTPFRQFGEEVGSALKQMFVDKGVQFVDNAQPEEFVGEDNSLTVVVLNNDSRLPADVCVIGAGCVPSSDFLLGSGIATTSGGHVIVDKHMKTNVDNVYAAGDVTEFPLVLCENDRVSIGHWQMAGTHGRTAALNMVNKQSEVRTVPYFWSMVFGKSIRYAGYCTTHDDVVIHGSLRELKFVAFYVRSGSVVAVSSMNFDPIVSQFAEVLASGKKISRDFIENDPHGFLSLL